MKATTKKIFKIIISLVYIVWGIYSPLSIIKAVFALDVGAIIAASVGVLTLLAGIFGLIGIKKTKCRAFGIVIMIFSIISIVYSIPMGGIPVNSIINAVLAWLFISCI
jgi:hypothetical protein